MKRSTSELPLVGITACWMHADKERTLYNGRTLLYLELSLGEWLLTHGGCIPVMIPGVAPGRAPVITAADYAERLDGLVLQGGADVAPGSYGQKPLRPEWAGDRIRDDYERALVEEFLKRDRPILGICRGHQMLNVALGGTLYQDITTQVPGALVHRDAATYQENEHDVIFEPDSRLREIYGQSRGRINSVHHQGIDEPGEGLAVEARSPADGVIEAVRLQGERYAVGIQWHPEFQDPSQEDLLAPGPIMDDFLGAIAGRRSEPV